MKLYQNVVWLIRTMQAGIVNPTIQSRLRTFWRLPT